MAELIERLMGVHTDGRRKLPVHQFYALAYEWKTGRITPAQARDALELTTAEEAEALAIVNSVPTSVANITAVVAHFRAIEGIHRVLCLAEQRIVPYDTPAAVRTRLGIPA